MNELDKETEEVLDVLNRLQPTAVDAPRPAPLALAQVKQQLMAARQQSRHYRLQQFLAAPARRYRTAGVLALLLFIFTFTFPNVRVAAGEFLSLFRVQNLAAVTISPEQLALLHEVAEGGLMPGEVEIFEDPHQLTLVDSLAQATGLTDVNARTLHTLGTPEAIYVSAPGSARLTIDLASARAILEAVGVSPLMLPDNLDGAQVTVNVFPGINQQWQDVQLSQAVTPELEYPDGLNTRLLGEALLQLLGLNEEEATRLAENIDWTTTLLLPIPADIATYQEVRVDGVSGMAISRLDGRAATIVWHKHGILYTLYGERSARDLVALADTLD